MTIGKLDRRPVRNESLDGENLTFSPQIAKENQLNIRIVNGYEIIPVAQGIVELIKQENPKDSNF